MTKEEFAKKMARIFQEIIDDVTSRCTHGAAVNGVRVTRLDCNCGFRMKLARDGARHEDRTKRRHRR